MIKGYYTTYGYMGYIPEENNWYLFSTERDYLEYIA